MGIVNKSFSFFNKGIGAASGFAKNHMFPAMKADYMALKSGFAGGANRYKLHQATNYARSTGFGVGGFKAGIGAYRSGFGRGFQDQYIRMGAGYNQSLAGMARLRRTGMSAGGIGAVGGMWGLSGE